MNSRNYKINKRLRIKLQKKNKSGLWFREEMSSTRKHTHIQTQTGNRVGQDAFM